MDEKLLTLTEVEKMLDVTRIQLYSYIKEGILKTVQYKPGGRHRVRMEDVMKLKNGIH